MTKEQLLIIKLAVKQDKFTYYQLASIMYDILILTGAGNNFLPIISCIVALSHIGIPPKMAIKYIKEGSCIIEW